MTRIARTMVITARHVALFLGAHGALCAASAAQDLWIDNVVIVSPERASPLQGASVYIHDGRIDKIARHSGSVEPSTTMKALGKPLRIAMGAVRFSLSRYTTAEEIDRTIEIVAVECGSE